MQEKLVVQFTPLPVYCDKSDYIVYCKACHSYHINNQSSCYKCGGTNSLASIESIVQKEVRRNFYNRTCFILIVYMLLFLVSRSFSTLILISSYTLACILLNLLIYTLFKPSLLMAEYDKYITLNQSQIKNNLKEMLIKAEEKIEEKKYLEAYVDLRYLGVLIDNEQIRLDKVNCLRHFRLRADLPLEMKELLVNKCNKYLIYYIYEVAQLKKEIINEATIKYILGYKKQILDLPKGEEIIAQVVMTALKSKYLTHKYASDIYEYIDYLPKDRLVRLLKIKDCILDQTLLQQIADKVKLKYGQDEQLNGYL